MKHFLLGATTMLILMAATCYATTLFTVHLIAHDAAGRTLQATAKGNSLAYSRTPGTGASVLTLYYTSDQILCSGFGQ